MLYGLLTAFLILFCFVSYILQELLRTIVPSFLEISIPYNQAEDLYLDGREVKFVTEDGVTLRGKFVEALGVPKGTILFCHEYGSDMNSCLRYAAFLKDRGFNVLRFDFRGHGISSNSPNYTIRQWTTGKELMDVKAAIDFLRNRGESRMGLLGISRGGAAGMICASMDGNIRAVVMDSTPDTRATLEYYMYKWVSIFTTMSRFYRALPRWAYWAVSYLVVKISELRTSCRFPSVARALRKKKCPVLMIYGMKDSYIDVSHANYLYACASEPKELWLVPGAKHNESALFREDEYRSRVSGFFEREFSERKISTVLPPDSSS